jgi:membrane-bound metal-dependent hydrolase YbcI (DUF457 family)
MPPTGFHGLLGLFFANRMNSKQKFARIGLVTGSVVPDLDLLGSVLIFLLTGDKFMTLAFHRSITHSFVVMIFILISGIILSLLVSRRIITNSTLFLLGLISGMAIHSVLDLFYLDGVSLLWPLQSFGERIKILPFTYEDFSPALNSLLSKVILTLDGHFELVFYLVFIHFANKYNTDQELSFNLATKKIKISNWPDKLRLISVLLVVNLILFLSLAFLSISWSFLGRDAFVILLYIPLTPIYLLSGVLPLLMKNTIAHLKTSG